MWIKSAFDYFNMIKFNLINLN